MLVLGYHLCLSMYLKHDFCQTQHFIALEGILIEPCGQAFCHLHTGGPCTILTVAHGCLSAKVVHFYSSSCMHVPASPCNAMLVFVVKSFSWLWMYMGLGLFKFFELSQLLSCSEF